MAGNGVRLLKTDLPQQKAPKELVHERYKDLALAEWAFRCSKTVQLKMRPIYVRLISFRISYCVQSST